MIAQETVGFLHLFRVSELGFNVSPTHRSYCDRKNFKGKPKVYDNFS